MGGCNTKLNASGDTAVGGSSFLGKLFLSKEDSEGSYEYFDALTYVPNLPPARSSSSGSLPGQKFPNKNVLPSVTFDPKDPLTPVIALYNYAARTDEELTFGEGDHLEVIGNFDWSWCKARPVEEYNTVGFIPSSHVAKPGTLESKPWFFLLSSRVDVERNLMASKNIEGAFLIRPCTTTPDASYALSVKNDGRVRHFIIRGSEEDGYSVVPKVTFDTLEKLVKFYQDNNSQSVPKLIKPCARLEAPQTIGLSHEMADKWEIPRNMIRLKKKLGNGNFGDVFDGVWNNKIRVAIKTLKQGNLDKTEFLKEAENMKKLIHPKVVQLFGVCTRDDPFYIVTELMSNGDLLAYLRKGKGSLLKVPQLIDIAAQVASGMAFLEQKKFVHRDLAARNVLVGDDNNCKVADFGFARLTQDDMYIATFKNVKLPVKWTAPESLKLKEFTTKSDVWAFGILLFEIIEKGLSPYPGMENSSIYPEITRGYRMPKTLMPHCPDKLYGIMLHCWNVSPHLRPTFAHLSKTLDAFYDD